MVDYWTFYKPDGRIVMVALQDDDEARHSAEVMGVRYIRSNADFDTDYVEDGNVVRRPENPARLDGYTIRDLPVPSEIIIQGTSYPWADPTAELDFTAPGRYVVQVKSFPYLDTQFMVDYETGA